MAVVGHTTSANQLSLPVKHTTVLQEAYGKLTLGHTVTNKTRLIRDDPRLDLPVGTMVLTIQKLSVLLVLPILFLPSP